MYNFNPTDLSPVIPILSESPPKPKLLDQVRRLIRAKHYSLQTERAYVFWIKRYILFHGKRHPADMGKVEVEAFLSHLATDNRAGTITVQVAASIVRHVTNGAEAHSLEESRSESLTTKASKNGLEHPLPESNSSHARNFALRLNRPDSDRC
jgi:hypothetical protein